MSYIVEIRKTVECLIESGDERLALVATALAGGLGQSASSSNTIWKSLCRKLSQQLTDSYLKVLFGFLASDGDWNLVLNETALPLQDRMLIALRFLNDGSVRFVFSSSSWPILITGLKKWNDKVKLMVSY
jgi:hypothetical protein